MTSEPYNVGVEREVLGAMLSREPVCAEVLSTSGLAPGDFYWAERHGPIFAAIQSLHGRGEPVDAHTVADDLGKAGKLEAVGGERAVSDLAAEVTVTAHAPHHAGKIREHALERRRQAIAQRLAQGEIDSAEAQRALRVLDAAQDSSRSDGIRAIPFAEIEEEKVDWLFEGRIPLGMLTLLLGDPGLGKSTFTTMLAGMVSRGGGNVLMSSAEDHKSAVIAPRLRVAGADLKRVFHVPYWRDGVEEIFALPDHGAELAREAAKCQARLVVIDPLMAHLPASVNPWSDQSIRAALAPLSRMAEEQHCAVVVVNHLNKMKGTNALHRSGGSVGLPGTVRSALLLGRDPDDPDPDRGTRRVLAHVKCNVAPQAPSLCCEVVPPEDSTGGQPRFKLLGTSTASTDDLLGESDSEARTQRDEAKDFLLAELANGSRLQKDLVRDAKSLGFSDTTLRRAKSDVGVTSSKDGLNGAWRWHLPEDDQPPHIPDVVTFGSRAKSNGHLEAQDGQGGQPAKTTASGPA